MYSQDITDSGECWDDSGITNSVTSVTYYSKTYQQQTNNFCAKSSYNDRDNYSQHQSDNAYHRPARGSSRGSHGPRKFASSDSNWRQSSGSSQQSSWHEHNDRGGEDCDGNSTKVMVPSQCVKRIIGEYYSSHNKILVFWKCVWKISSYLHVIVSSLNIIILGQYISPSYYKLLSHGCLQVKVDQRSEN